MKAVLRFLKKCIVFVLRSMLQMVERLSFSKKRETGVYGNFCFSGDYPNWEVAYSQSLGYDNAEAQQDNIQNVIEVKDKFLKDFQSVSLAESSGYTEFSRWPQQSHFRLSLMYAVSKIKPTGTLGIVDFGGLYGSHYFENRRLLQKLGIQKIDWAVIEQSSKVENGEKCISTDELHFFETVEKAVEHQSTDILIASGVLQYIGLELELLLELICLSKFKYVIIDRSILIEDVKDRISIQSYTFYGQPRSYPLWIFNRKDFYKAIEKDFTVLQEFSSDLDGPYLSLQNPEGRAVIRGFLLERKF